MNRKIVLCSTLNQYMAWCRVERQNPRHHVWVGRMNHAYRLRGQRFTTDDLIWTGTPPEHGVVMAVRRELRINGVPQWNPYQAAEIYAGEQIHRQYENRVHRFTQEDRRLLDEFWGETLAIATADQDSIDFSSDAATGMLLSDLLGDDDEEP